MAKATVARRLQAQAASATAKKKNPKVRKLAAAKNKQISTKRGVAKLRKMQTTRGARFGEVRTKMGVASASVVGGARALTGRDTKLGKALRSAKTAAQRAKVRNQMRSAISKAGLSTERGAMKGGPGKGRSLPKMNVLNRGGRVSRQSAGSSSDNS